MSPGHRAKQEGVPHEGSNSFYMNQNLLKGDDLMVTLGTKIKGSFM